MGLSAYVFHAAYLCESCGEKAINDIRSDYPDIDPETLGSDDFPYGPYDMAFQEADSPQHCDWCGLFLRNPLTTDGYEHVLEMVLENEGPSEVMEAWAEFYHIPPVSVEQP